MKKEICFDWSINDSPKRTVLSTWKIRNDSSNVGGILQPETHEYVRPPKLSSDPKTTNSRARGVFEKCILSENSCYCKDKQIKPKLMSRPKTCLSFENFTDEFIDGDLLLRRSSEPSQVLEECRCKGDGINQINTTDLTSLKTCQEEPTHKCSCLTYTESRQDYEIFREEQNIEFLKETANYTDIVGDRNEEAEEEADHSLPTVTDFRETGTTKTSSTTDWEESHRTVAGMNGFRKQHYFETHSTENLGKDVADHICGHQFKLDDRLLPLPVNVDPYGRSRCSICFKPMEGGSMQLSKSYFSERPSGMSLGNIAKCSELGLTSRNISIGGNRTRIELQIDARKEEKLGMLVGRIQKPEYFNTYALRQQKMSH